jgi:signal transduction histidine kinase
MLQDVEHCVDGEQTRNKGALVRSGWQIENGAVDATAFVAGMAETMRILAGEKPVRVELVTPDTPVMVTVDVVVLSRVIMNLVRSALRSTERGKITIALKVIGCTSEIVVTDTGSGHRSNRPAGREAAMYHDGVSRVDGKNEPDLGVSRYLARLLGGSISVRSAHGGGAMFTLTLPLRAAEQRRALYALD